MHVHGRYQNLKGKTGISDSKIIKKNLLNKPNVERRVNSTALRAIAWDFVVITNERSTGFIQEVHAKSNRKQLHEAKI